MNALDVLHQVINIGSNLPCMENRNKINNTSRVHLINNLKRTLLCCPVWESVIRELSMRKHSIPLSWLVFYQSSQNIPKTPVYHFSLPICLGVIGTTETQICSQHLPQDPPEVTSEFVVLVRISRLMRGQ